MNGIRITIFLLIVIHVLPIAVTQLLILEYPFKEGKSGRILKWAVTAANILLNGLVLYEIIIYTKLDLIEISNFVCSYQDISRLAFSNIVSIAVSVLIGIGLHRCVCKFYHDKRSPRFSSKCVLLVLIAAIPIIQGYQYGYSGASDFSIVEICRKTTVLDTAEYPLDEDAIGDGVCYVTVVNSGVLTYELDQMYLSDNMDNLRERQFVQSLEIKPGETYRFYMSSGDSLDIKKSGGSILYLSNKYGNVVDRVEVPALNENEIYKNMEAGWQIVNSMEANEIVAVSAPSFSHEGGFYEEAFELELTASPGTSIYYTLDSSNPTAESMEYSGPIYVYDRSGEENRYSSFVGEKPVDKCFVVRAAAVDSDGNFSDIITKSYFINQEKYKDKTVISLVSDPDRLFGDNGIYVAGKEFDEWYLDAVAKAGEDGEIDTSDAPTENYLQRGIEWERESNLEVFKNTDIQLNQPVGIRIQGANARDYSLKRFSIFARDEYGSSDFFDVNLLNDYRQHSLYLREGDLHAMSQLLGKGRNVATTDFVTVDVFLDGEFWYTTYLHEKFRERNFSEKYNLSKDNIAISTNGLIYDEMAEGKNPLVGLNDFINQYDLADDEKYLEFNEMLDIQSYIDWHCFNAFLLNLDLNERLNCLFWHTIIPEDNQLGDSRWRLGLYDMDLKWYTSRPYEENPFTRCDINNWPIYSALRESEIFCEQYVLTFMDLINTNLSVENTTAIIEELSGKNTMTIVKALGIEQCRDFFENRPACVVPYLAEEFELTGTQEAVTLSSNVAGTPITLNTISPELQPSADTFSWTGRYFTDYPVTVTANASNFSHWEVTVSGDVQTFTDAVIEVPVAEGGVQIYAVFK